MGKLSGGEGVLQGDTGSGTNVTLRILIGKLLYERSKV